MKSIMPFMAGLLACLLLLCCAGCGSSGAGGSGGSTASYSKPRADTVKAGEEGDIPLLSNGFLVAERTGKTVRMDLDGDGEEESLRVIVEKDNNADGKNSWTEPVLSSISVNGKEYAAQTADNPMEAYGICIENPNPDHYYITDLDTGDRMREIAIPDAGPSDDKVTWYFQYRNGELRYIGALPGYPDDQISKRDGNGNVMAEGRLSLLQTWYATFSFALRNGKLEEVPQSWYIPIQDFQNAVTLKRELSVFARPDRKADTVTIKPSQQTVSFPSTDNKHWVQIRLTDGTEGWIYMKDSGTILSGGEELTQTEVFENLILAD